MSEAADAAAMGYGVDDHYDVASAFIKSIRGSDPDAGLYWLARMLEAGEDPRFVARRLVILASEDVGMADPQGVLVADAAARAVEYVGLPEASLNLAHAVVYLATAPKSNRVTVALGRAREEVRSRRGEVPPHLRDAHYSGAKGLGTARVTSTPRRPAAGDPSSTADGARPASTTSRHLTASSRRSTTAGCAPAGSHGRAKSQATPCNESR